MISTQAEPPALPEEPPLAAATRVYRLPELFERILRQLAEGELAKCLRLEKGCMGTVARELYHTVDYKTMEGWTRSVASDERRKLYSEAISVIRLKFHDGYSDLSFELRERLSTEHLDITTYDPAIYETLIPLIRTQCPGIKRIHFGNSLYWDTAHPSWTVDFKPPSPSTPLATHGLIDTHVALIASVKVSADEPTSTLFDFENPSPPSSNCSIIRRFAFKLDDGMWQDMASLSLNLDRWREMMYKDPRLDLCSAIYIDVLPINLDLVVSIYERQIAAGRVDRLEVVRVQADPCTLHDFAGFARVASSSLRSLALNAAPGLPFSCWPELSTIIHNDLPNLHWLQMSLRVTAQTEEECGAWLTESCLEPGGRLYRLSLHLIGARDLPTPCLNLVRCLSPLVTSGAHFYLGDEYGMRFEAGDTSASVLSYLQPHHRRVHLSTVDFPSLGIHNIQSVLNLDYHDDGRPRARVDLGDKPASWAGATTALSAAPAFEVAIYSSTLIDLETASKELLVNAKTANTLQRLQQAALFLQSVRKAKRVGVELAKEVAERVAMNDKKLSELEEGIENEMSLLKAARPADV